VPGIAILETTGRKSGQPRRTPVGRSLDGDTCWTVAEHGRNASHVRKSTPTRASGSKSAAAGAPEPPTSCRTTTHARLRAMPVIDAAVVRLMGTDLLTVRVDLDPERRPAAGPPGAAVPPAGP
jgi:hypothetical protein